MGLDNVATEDAQKQRFAMLAGKRLLFVGGDFMYKEFASSMVDLLRKLREHGVVVTAVFQSGLDEPSKYYLEMKEKECFDGALFADVGAEDGAHHIVKAVEDACIELDAAWSCHEATQPIVAGVQEALGLPGNPLEAYEIARDKYATRKALEKHGLNSIKAVQIWSSDDAATAAEHVGFPMIVKPTVGMGSSGVYRVDSREQLDETLGRLFEDIRNDWTLNRNSVGSQAPVLAETFVLPNLFYGGKINEFDCEVLLWDGQVVYSNIIDNLTTRPPFFQEVGSCAPTMLPTEREQAMKEYAVQCVKAMGFTRGGFHVECWDTAEGPLLIEVNSRVGGGATQDTHIACWGVDPMMEFALSMMDIPINPPRAEQPYVTYGYLLPNAEVTGHLHEQLSFLETAKESKMYRAHKYFCKPSNFVKGNDKYIAQWLGEIRLEYDGDKNVDVLKEMHVVLDNVARRSAEETTPITL
jgi:carnosine synthase